jgi:hypothetical protein
MNETLKPLIGAALAGALGVVTFVAVLAWILASPQGDAAGAWGGLDLVAILLAVGTPVGILLGWRFAARVRRWHPVFLVGWMAVSAVLVGDAEVSALIAAAGIITGHLELIPFAALAFVVGLLAYGMFILPVTVVGATLWLVAFAGLDRLVGRGRGSRPRSEFREDSQGAAA